MKSFDPQSYSPLVAQCWSPEPLPALAAGEPRREVAPALKALDEEALFRPHAIVDRDAAMGCVSALWLWNNFLDESHTISQDINTTSGSFWHGIMHRREPDYSNAKYWVRRIGQHPIYAPLAKAAAELAAASGVSQKELAAMIEGQAWDADGFVDLCQLAVRRPALETLCRQIAAVEWQLLFDHDWRRAIGKS